MELVDDPTVYALSDADRTPDEEVFPSWEASSRGLAGNLSITEGPKKRRWSLSWAQLLRDTADDGGAGADDLEALYEATDKTYTLRVYSALGVYDSYTVAMRSFRKTPVPMSRRQRYSVSLTLEEV